ncbi:unnamed protein product [Echinostoma caproni]|uniref:BRCT domain-containing protein n=1 Tax=Echinostoma caproni TaxID=27848 RepID=A0A3P8KTU3_9TREM|nr:unnamed protein product [Echinostoma caproni]
MSFDWIETCAHVKMRVEEEGFEVTGCSTTPHSGAPRRARLAREAGSLGTALHLSSRVLSFQGEFEYPMPPRNELARLVRTGGAVVVSCRERCSPLRLARLAIEGTQTREATVWELSSPTGSATVRPVPGGDTKDDEDGESDDEQSILDSKQPNLLHSSTSLLVVYDSRSQSRQQRQPGANVQSTPYAVQVVSDALSLVRPCRVDSLGTNVEPVAPPLRAVPASWILDCAAEYTILPLSSF